MVQVDGFTGRAPPATLNDEQVLIEQGLEVHRPSCIFVRATKQNDRQDNQVVNVRVGGNCVEVLAVKSRSPSSGPKRWTVAALTPMARSSHAPECHWRARHFTGARILFSIHLAPGSQKRNQVSN
jgi:hypothetical protein